jgi:hypothetical protein
VNGITLALQQNISHGLIKKPIPLFLLRNTPMLLKNSFKSLLGWRFRRNGYSKCGVFLYATVALILLFISPYAFAADTLCDGKYPEIISTKFSKIEKIINKNDYKDLLAAHMKNAYEAAAHAYDDKVLRSRFEDVRNDLANQCNGPLLKKVFSEMDESLSEADIEAVFEMLSKKNAAGSDMEYLESLSGNADVNEKYKAYVGRLDATVTGFMSQISAVYKERACAAVRNMQGPKEVIKYTWSAFINQRQRAVYIYADCEIE